MRVGVGVGVCVRRRAGGLAFVCGLLCVIIDRVFGSVRARVRVIVYEFECSLLSLLGV